MVPLTALLIPILLSAVVVFVASSIIHMALGYHRSDFKKLPDEDGVMDALRPFNIPPGDYVIPNGGGPSAMKDPVFLEKYKRGPIAVATFIAPGIPSMGKNLAAWFVYSVVVSLFSGYIASRALGPGAEYLDVFRFAGTTAFAGYALALWQRPIWYKQAWTTTLKVTFDGFVYALLTAGVFGWLWP